MNKPQPDSCEWWQEIAQALAIQYRDMRSALVDVLAQFDAGYFVRNTDSDGCSDWAMKAVEPLRALAAAQALLKATERSNSAESALDPVVGAHPSDLRASDSDLNSKPGVVGLASPSPPTEKL